MANVDAPMGFTPAGHLTGGMIRQNEYQIASAYATATFTGDVVILLSTGVINQATADPSNPIGIFAGVQYVDTNSGEQKYSPYWPAAQVASNIKASVYDDPMIIYRVQTSGTLTDPDDIGTLFDLVIGTGSTVNGTSAMEIDGAGATGAGMFRLLRGVDDPANDLSAANSEWYVSWSGEHEFFGTDGV